MFQVHRVWSLLQPQRPRHPLVRILLGFAIACVLVVLLVVGVVVGAVVFAVSLCLRLLRGPAAAMPPREVPAAPAGAIDAAIRAGTIEGEFSVLRKPQPRIGNG